MQLYVLEERCLPPLGFCDKNYPFILSRFCDSLSHDLICVLNTQQTVVPGTSVSQLLTNCLSKCTVCKKERSFSSCVTYTLTQESRTKLLCSSLRTYEQSYGEKTLSGSQLKIKFLVHPLFSSLSIVIIHKTAAQKKEVLT